MNEDEGEEGRGGTVNIRFDDEDVKNRVPRDPEILRGIPVIVVSEGGEREGEMRECGEVLVKSTEIAAVLAEVSACKDPSMALSATKKAVGIIKGLMELVNPMASLSSQKAKNVFVKVHDLSDAIGEIERVVTAAKEGPMRREEERRERREVAKAAKAAAREREERERRKVEEERVSRRAKAPIEDQGGTVCQFLTFLFSLLSSLLSPLSSLSLLSSLLSLLFHPFPSSPLFCLPSPLSSPLPSRFLSHC